MGITGIVGITLVQTFSYTTTSRQHSPIGDCGDWVNKVETLSRERGVAKYLKMGPNAVMAWTTR
jgi:hypothetical protein